MSTEGARQHTLLNLSGKRTEKNTQTLWLRVLIYLICSGAADFASCSFFAPKRRTNRNTHMYFKIKEEKRKC